MASPCSLFVQVQHNLDRILEVLSLENDKTFHDPEMSSFSKWVKIYACQIPCV